MRADTAFWLFVALLFALIALSALGHEPPAKPIGYLFIGLALLTVVGLVVRWRRERKARKEQEQPA